MSLHHDGKSLQPAAISQPKRLKYMQHRKCAGGRCSAADPAGQLTALPQRDPIAGFGGDGEGFRGRRIREGGERKGRRGRVREEWSGPDQI